MNRGTKVVTGIKSLVAVFEVKKGDSGLIRKEFVALDPGSQGRFL